MKAGAEVAVEVANECSVKKAVPGTERKRQRSPGEEGKETWFQALEVRFFGGHVHVRGAAS